jgi:putative membrane protein
MRRILLHFVIDTASLWAVSQIAEGMVFEQGITTLILAGVALTIASLFAKPVINMLLLPINLVTFGLFRWVSSAVVLYIVTLIIGNFKIQFFRFDGFTSKWFDMPPLYFEGMLAFIGFAFILSIFTSFLHWLHK